MDGAIDVTSAVGKSLGYVGEQARLLPYAFAPKADIELSFGSYYGMKCPLSVGKKKRSLMLMGIRGGSTANSSIPTMGRLGGTRSPAFSAGEQLCHLQYVEHTEGDGSEMFKLSASLALRASSQRSSTRPIAPVRGERG
jgi:hypothetical protein